MFSIKENYARVLVVKNMTVSVVLCSIHVSKHGTNIVICSVRGWCLPYFQLTGSISYVVTNKRWDNVVSPGSALEQGCSLLARFFISKSVPDENICIYDIQNIF